MRTRLALAVGLVLAAAAVRAGEVPGALLVVESAPGTPGSDPTGAPPRFALLRDGQAFVGGTWRVETVRLEKGELSALRKRVDAARKAVGRSSRLVLGEGGPLVRLRFPEDPPVEVQLGSAPPAPGEEPDPVAALVADVLSFRHPGLVPYEPPGYALVLREGALAGGCRPWNLATPFAEAKAGPLSVPADQALGWPTGALPGSVCGPDAKRYVLTLRPLLPGEQP
ncbi:MAG: hypothetical protein U0599_21880 [Vicinamibacteria bacterium]